MPFEIESETGAVFAACFRTSPNYRRARAAILYRSVGRGLILALKMADRTCIAPALGGWVSRAGAELLEDADLITRVPLHCRGLLALRFNQSALLAATVSRDFLHRLDFEFTGLRPHYKTSSAPQRK